MTNPTGKNRFEAGKNGIAAIATESRTISPPRRKMATKTTFRNPTTKMIVDKFLGSAKDVTKGMDRIVQSQHKSLGDVKSQKFLARRYVLKVSRNIIAISRP